MIWLLRIGALLHPSFIIYMAPYLISSFLLNYSQLVGMSDYVGASLIIGACALSVFLDVPGDAKCEVDSEGALIGECEPPKRWPMGGE